MMGFFNDNNIKGLGNHRGDKKGGEESSPNQES
jgi:hypothetical protein